MKEMAWYLLGVVTKSQWGGSPAQCPMFNRTIECTLALLEFYMYARFKSHDDATLSFMVDALNSFHTSQDGFLLGRDDKKAKAKANILRTEFVRNGKVNEERNTKTWMPS